jgi:hypothetical protein
MASTKSNPQSGIGTTRTPFSTADGRVPAGAPAGGRPTDLVASGGVPNASARGGGRDFLKDPTGTPVEGDAPRDLTADPSMNPGQRPATPEQRVNPQSVAKGGTSIPRDPGAVARGGTGTLGNASRPFKGMK